MTRSLKRLVPRFAPALAVASLLSAPALVAAPAQADPVPYFWAGHAGQAEFSARAAEEMKLAQQALDQLVSTRGPRTIENTLVPYNEAVLHADNAASQANLMQEVHPDSVIRATAEEVDRRAEKFLNDLGLNRDAYDAVKAVDVSKADAATKYFVMRTLRDYRRSGVDRDPETRKRISALLDTLVVIGQDFERNIRDDSRTIQVPAADLAGMPEDYLKAHPAGPDGKVTISIEYPDYFPVMNYCPNGAVRKQLFLAAQNRAYPKNMAVLELLLEKRFELARILGYKTWADYVTEDKMIGSARRAAEFIQKLNDLTLKHARDEYAVYLKRKQEDDPRATQLDIWDRRYYGEQIRRRDYNFDMQQARPYFPFDEVKQGVLGATSKMFGLTYKKIDGADVWDPSVEAYDVYDDTTRIGRFYLDLHPRPNKYSHAAKFTIHAGVTGVQVPEGVLVCNFPGGKPDDPGLMEHDDVMTFFHEFGHLIHQILGGRQRWEPVSGVATEWDFVEAPSQLLEEWTWNPGVLQTFAKHYQTGEPIPAEMVARMRRADSFGRAVSNSFQIYYSAVSLDLYDRDPKGLDPDALVDRIEPRYQPFPHAEGTHLLASFGHLTGYSAIYYTYEWSLVIAKDLFTQFNRSNLLDPTVARRYRDEVLAPGGSKPAAELVRAFLGRDFRYDAYEKWLTAKD